MNKPEILQYKTFEKGKGYYASLPLVSSTGNVLINKKNSWH